MAFFKGAEHYKSKEYEQLRFDRMTVFVVRHGSTKYLEQTQPNPIAIHEEDLTDLGRKEIQEAAETIEEKLKSEKDKVIVWVISSPRRRAVSSAKKIGKHLRENGYMLLNDLEPFMGNKNKNGQRPKTKHEIQPRVRNIDIYDEQGRVLEPGTSEYAKVFNTAVEKVKAEMQNTGDKEQWILKFNHDIFPELEPYTDNDNKKKTTQRRSRDQMTYFVRLARYVQPEVERNFHRRLVIIEAEHVESLDDFYTQASTGAYSIDKGNEVRKGEVVQVDIPIDKKANTISATFLGRNPSTTEQIPYDHLKRTFGYDW